MSEVMYTKEQLDIELLQQKNYFICSHLLDVESALKELKMDIQYNRNWTIGAVFLIYVDIICSALAIFAKKFGWF